MMSARLDYNELGAHRPFVFTHLFSPLVDVFDGYAPGGGSEW